MLSLEKSSRIKNDPEMLDISIFGREYALLTKVYHRKPLQKM